jgi:CrcB protein
MLKLTLIALGGAFGALLRYGVSAVAQRMHETPLPIGTFVVNVSGCLVIGLLGGLMAGPYAPREETRVLLMVGLLGAFTTFSTYGLETVNLLGDRQFGAAAVNVLASNAVGLLAVWLGYRASVAWFGV